MMRSKLMLWGAAAAIALTSTAVMANVVVVKSLGPSAKAYPPGKTLSESAKITLQGGDIVTVLGPASAQTLRGPGNFDAKQVTLASAAAKRGRFGALRAAEVPQRQLADNSLGLEPRGLVRLESELFQNLFCVLTEPWRRQV